MSTVFRKATDGDLPAVLALYRSVLGTEGCTWDEDYPSEREAKGDLSSGGLYVFESDGKLIGAISVLSGEEFDGLAGWRGESGGSCELSRLAVSTEEQGKGRAKTVAREALKEARKKGYTSARLLVSKVNRAAVGLYRSLGFDFVGECHKYGIDFFACEKIL